MTGGGAKEAVTDTEESSVTEQAPVPVHWPSHPPNVEGETGVAVKLTTVPAG
jgi:hypothetical protein